MDAATPLRRWLRTATLVALGGAAGCKTTESDTVYTDPVSYRDAVRRNDPSAFLNGVANEQGDASDRDDQRRANEAAFRANNPGAAVPKARPQMPGDPAAVPGRPVAGQAVPASYSPASNADKSKPLDGDARIKVVAVVGAGNIVTDEEVWEAVRQRASDYLSKVEGQGGLQVLKDDAKEKSIYADELRRTVERELVLDEMYTRLKKAGKAAVIDNIKEFAGKAADAQIRTFRKRSGADSDETFKMILATQGLTTPVIRRQLERQMMAQEYVRTMLKERGKSVGLAEVRDYYDRNPDEFRTPDRVKWLHIFISFNKFPTPRAAYDRAMEVREQAARGVDFAALSRTHDNGLAGPQGGEGSGSERGKIEPADVEPAVWALQPGQVSGLIETAAGYHIVKVAERETAGVRPFDEKTQDQVRGKLMMQLQEREYKRLVEDLWRRGTVQIIAGQ